MTLSRATEGICLQFQNLIAWLSSTTTTTTGTAAVNPFLWGLTLSYFSCNGQQEERLSSMKHFHSTAGFWIISDIGNKNPTRHTKQLNNKLKAILCHESDHVTIMDQMLCSKKLRVFKNFIYLFTSLPNPNKNVITCFFNWPSGQHIEVFSDLTLQSTEYCTSVPSATYTVLALVEIRHPKLNKKR